MKVGNVVGAYYRGTNYMRSLPRKSTKPFTEGQLKQQMKFGLVVAFLRPINGLIKVGYQSHKVKETPINAATSYHLENAITGVYPALTVDFPKIRYSKGSLLPVAGAEVVTTESAEIDFNWTNNAAVGTPEGTDKATLLVYNPIEKLFVMLEGAAARSAATFTLVVPPSFSGTEVHCWMSFVSVDKKHVSDSVYVGLVPVL